MSITLLNLDVPALSWDALIGDLCRPSYLSA